jgi:hypothetical protein
MRKRDRWTLPREDRARTTAGSQRAQEIFCLRVFPAGMCATEWRQLPLAVEYPRPNGESMHKPLRKWPLCCCLDELTRPFVAGLASLVFPLDSSLSRRE